MDLKTILLFFLIVIAQSSVAQRQKAVDILTRVEQSHQGLEDYTVDLQADVNMERIRMPKMQATMYFKSPDKVHFESPNFALLPREGFGIPVPVLVSRYDPIFKGEEELKGVRVARLQLIAKEPTLRIQQLHVWVDLSKYAIVKTETIPYQGRSVRVEFDYGLEAGKYWLPGKLRVEFENVGADTIGGTFEMPVKPEMQEFRRPPRKGSIEISYTNYRINTGLTDEFFSRKESAATEKKE